MTVPETAPSAADVDAGWHDTKLAQRLYHDWESQRYDDKWSVGFDDRCRAYVCGRFTAVAGEQGRPYARSLEVGCGTGFFTLNLLLAGVVREGHLSDISPGMVAAAQDNAERLGLTVDGRVADAEALPYPDDSFDLVVGHAVIHHVPDVELALREMRRVLRPGGRLVLCGEPTRCGDRVARRLSRWTWEIATRGTRLPMLRAWARSSAELDASSRAAALEAVVDLHTFDPTELAATARRAGLGDVRTVTHELTAAWWGWPVRTFECAVAPERLGMRWRTFAYRSWCALSALDERLRAVAPAAWYYNVSLTGRKAP